MIYLDSTLTLKLKFGEVDTTNAPHWHAFYSKPATKQGKDAISQVDSQEIARGAMGSPSTTAVTLLQGPQPVTSNINVTGTPDRYKCHVFICNRDTVARTAFLYTLSGTATEYYILSGVSIPAGGTIYVSMDGAVDVTGTPITSITAGAALTGGGSSGAVNLDVAVDNSSIEVSGDALRVKADGIADTMLRNSNGLSVIGRAANSTGDPADIVAATDGDALMRVGTAVGFNNYGALTTTDLATDDEIPFSDTGSSGANKNTTVDRLLGFGPHVFNARLTLTSGTPVTTSDVTAAATIYLTPYNGNRVRVYDGTRWKIYALTEKSLAIGTLASAVIPNDIFLYDNAGTLTLEKLAWTNTTTRATALTTQDGVLVKSGDSTRLYVGSFYPASTTTTEDSLTKRLLYSWYNQVEKPMYRHDTTSSWTYGGTSWQQARATSANMLEIMNGAPAGYTTGMIQIHTSVIAVNGSAGAFCYNSIGEDSITVAHANTQPGTMRETTYEQIEATLRVRPTAGYHYYAWLEAVSAGTGTFGSTLGTSNGEIKSGMAGNWLT